MYNAPDFCESVLIIALRSTLAITLHLRRLEHYTNDIALHAVINVLTFRHMQHGSNINK